MLRPKAHAVFILYQKPDFSASQTAYICAHKSYTLVRNNKARPESESKPFKHLLVEESVVEDIEERAETLFNELWCNGDRKLFSETIEVLEYFKRNGYKIGVISDTSPSLEFTLQQLGIAKYFTSFTASSLVGAGKPSPIIFNAALSAQGVTAEESLYVDDYKPEADGARQQGFTSFLIDRNQRYNDEWTINDLRQLIEYVEKQN